MSGLRFFPEAASTVASRVDDLYLFLVVLSLFFGLLIAGAIVVLMVRYRRREDDERTPEIHGSLLLEAVWMAIPLAIALGIFAWGASLYAAIRRPPNDALRVNVVGKQWMWKVQHLEGKREINELHVPVGRPVRLQMISEDVIHSFYIPAFRIKQDVLPGRYSELWFEATRPGEYHLFCAEYCGTKHSGMIGKVVVMEAAAYEQWLMGTPTGETMEQAGERLFVQNNCNTCHHDRADARGPVLQGAFGKPVRLESGQTVVVDEAYVRESILNPAGKVVAGYRPVMPTYQGQISEEGVLQLLAYIRSLRERPQK